MEHRTHKRLKIVLLSILVLLAVAVCGFLIWAGDYYRADGVAAAAMQSDSSIETEDNLTILSPGAPADTGIIFYPGAKVEASAYLPLLEKLKAQGFACVLVKMPLNMAIFNPDAADKAIAAVPGIKHWYIAGHSMGGAMASSYASKNPGKVDGLILLGAYIYGDYPPAKTLTVYGSLNSGLEKNIHYTENIVKIEGGNHAQFGNYGRQKGDPDAAITADQQQNITVKAIADFIGK
jgi:pimeloyl-ACP methyl ester carboxylesterase